MEQSNFPVILYDIDNNTLPINCISKSNSFFIRSYQKFKIEIIEDNITENKIYSVKQNPNPVDQNDLFLITSAKNFGFENFAYSIFLDSNSIINVTGIDNITRTYYIEYRPENVLTEAQEHYNDLLTNNFLPTFSELEPAIISENKAEIIKRLLLDFKNIVNKKGTKTGITKFLNLIGFNPESIKVYDEYIVNNKNSDDNVVLKTITPNKERDYKSGYYHVLYDNWIVDDDEKYTIKNLPKRIINISDVTEFFIKLEKAISLANIYFTLPEQDISFFGLNNSANIEKYLSIAGNTSIIHNMDFHYFRKKIHIDIVNFQSSERKEYLVKNNLQLINSQAFTEIKTYSINHKINNELYLVDSEIHDDTVIDDTFDINKIESTFGNLLNIKINSLNTYCEYIIENVNNPLTKIKSNKVWLTEQLELNVVAKKSGIYKITVLIYDIHNNREKYIYNYSITNNFSRIDFEIFNSSHIIDNDNELNKLSIDIDSTYETTQINENYVLKFDDIPTNLKDYYTQTPSLLLRYLVNNKRFILPEINKNYIVDEVSETIPVDFYDNWLNILSYKYDDNYSLKLKRLNPETLLYEYFDYSDVNCYLINPDNLFITLMDIVEQDTNGNEIINAYVFITTTEIGIEINKELYDFVLINKNDNTDIISLYDIIETNGTKTKIPVNYDFPLFFKESNLFPDFENYPVIDINDISTIPIIKSIYPRLINISDNKNYYLKLGDIIVCRPNNKYIIENVNIKWTIINSFTNEIIYTTNDYVLKYRIKENTIYNIKLEFDIDNVAYQIEKKSLQSSFK